MPSTSLTFTLEGRDRLSRILDNAGDSASDLEKKLAMVGAAIPAAAALAPLVAQTGAAAVAVAAFGAAIVPQIGALSDASQAQKKYEDAVAKSGATSEDAITAQLAFQRQMAKMPPASREAAAGLSTLKKEYQGWSDGLAKDTMPVFTKGLAVASAMLPKLTPLVKGASTELNRFMTVVAGGVNTSAFDKISSKFSDFATGSLKRANDGLIHLLRTFDTAKVGGSLSQFMDYARQQGPMLASTLKNVATAALNLLQAASGVGVGLLQLANAAAKVVAALPPGFITVLMQTALAIRAVTLATKGIQLAAGAYALVRAQIAAMGTAAIGASGAVGTLRAMFMALSVSARAAVAATGIGLLVVALVELASLGKKAPPDVDKLTTALGKLGQTGQVTGEAAAQFGTHFEKLKSQIDKVIDPSVAESINNWGAKWSGGLLSAGDATEELTGSFTSIDESLANMVRGGNAKMAAAALKNMLSTMKPEQVKKLQGSLDKYKDALADQKFEQDLAAESMGLFGAQAQKTQAALAEQQRSADGLRQSIMALNEAHRSAFDADTKFAAAIDNVAKSLKDNGKTLDINTEKGRANRDALSQLASATEESAAQARANGASWSTVSGIYDKGRKSLIDNAYAITGNRKEAKALADQLLRTPDKTARLKGNLDDLKSKLDEAAKRLKNAPSSKQTAIRGNIDDLKFKISEAQRRLNAIDGKTAVTYVVMKTTTSNAGTVFHEGGNYASGGPIGFPGGGPISGPGTGTSDSIPIMASNGEYVINARSTAKYRSLIEAINAGTLGGGRGMPGAGAAVAQGLMSGMAGATSGVGTAARTMAAAVVAGVKGELQIASPSKKMKALAADIGKGLIVGLTGSQAKIKSVAADLAKDIRTAFSGKKESHLVAYVNKQTGKLLAAAKKRDAIAAKIAEARKYASDVTTAARESAGLSNLGMEPEQVTAGGIKAGLAGKLAQINQFTKYIGILAKKGLSKGLLRQILDMGPDAGYAYASALVGADKATFASINKTQNAVDKASTALGRSGADILYDSGKQAGKGFLKGLEGQQKDIEKLMMSIAKGMQKAIKKALGIKSPSTVMAQLGRYSTQGLARGLVDGVPVLDRALDVVTGRVAGAQPVIGRPAVRAGGGGVVINLTVEVRPGADAQAVWREIRQGLLSLKRGNGGGSLGLA
jgi:chorismate mutase